VEGAALVPTPSCAVVVGATGQLGRAVVLELLAGGTAEVRALARDMDKAKEAFADVLVKAGDRLCLIQCDAGDEKALMEACEGADAAVWCVSSGAGGGPLEQAAYFLESAFNLQSAEERGLAALGKAFAPAAPGAGSPQVVMVSSAAVTRPAWSEEKRQRLAGCADIPIVRLNPFGILDKKRVTEDVLRNSGVRYTVVRPVGLNDQGPPGRPLLVQGDVAVGRISRADLAELIVQLLTEPEASGKTFETLAVAGYSKSEDYSKVLAKLRRDDDPRPLDEAAVAATYDVLQQLLPGKKQDSAALAMGQSYEQLDTGAEGRLGPRGKERVPERVA